MVFSLNTKSFAEVWYRSYGDNQSKRYSSLDLINLPPPLIKSYIYI